MDNYNCIHGGDLEKNEIGENVCYCELSAKCENVTLGDCLGNCDSQQPY